MTATTTAGPGEGALLAAARGGDGDAFRTLLAPHVPAIQVHCYRMLGSFHDAEEATQDTLLRAWRGLHTYEGRAPLRHWLYRIATTTCLKARQSRARQPATVTELTYLQPYPDRLLDELPADGDPAAEVEQRESVSLAFVTALQLLPATQSAVLILRDVLAWTSAEVADLLETSVAAVNSALQRARATVRATAPHPPPARPLPEREREIVAGFVHAWHRRDIDGLAALLREDVIMRMPPEAMDLYGRDAVIRFFATVPAQGRLETIQLVPTRANGQPALAAYETGDDGRLIPYGLMVLTLAADAVIEITGFPGVEPVDAVQPSGPGD